MKNNIPTLLALFPMGLFGSATIMYMKRLYPDDVVNMIVCAFFTIAFFILCIKYT